MISRHPSKKVLGQWLADHATPSVDQHVATCQRCSVALDDLATAETDGLLQAALASALEPPTDLVPRLEARVVERLDSRRVFGYMADLFGAGLETTRLLLDLPEDES